MALLRLDKYLTDAGVCSRRESAALIRSGRVLVDGNAVSGGAVKIETEKAVVTVDGEPVKYSKFHYLMMNKPTGVVSATEDSRDKTVLSLLEAPYSRMKLFPAGRLDKDAEGLLLLTDDGDFAHRVISPNKRVYKRYYAETAGALTREDADAFSRGIVLRDGLNCLPGELEIISSGEESACYVTICEGKYHQIKRMLASLGKPVTYLKRVSIGSLQIDDSLSPGGYRELTDEEKNAVFI